MKKKITDDASVLWPSRLEGTGAVVMVETTACCYRFEFTKNGVLVTGDKIDRTPMPAKIHGMQFLSRTLYSNRIKTGGQLEFNDSKTNMIKAITIEAPEKVMRQAIGKWPEERGGPFH